MTIREALQDKRAEIFGIAAAHGATEVRLFGSAATDELREDSDIDILVTMRAGSSLLDLIAIKQDVEELLGRRVDVVTEESLSPYIRDEVLKKAVNL